MDIKDQTATESYRWRDAFALFIDPRAVRMFMFGFAAGLPLLLIFSTLSVWLVKAGVDRGTVTFFSWAGLSYGFKVVWAPLIDRISLPVLSPWLGHRRGWLLLAQFGVVAALLFTASADPANALVWTAVGAVGIGFASATQDIVIDAYRIESAPPRMQAVLSATYIAGYRVAMLTSGAGALWLAAWLGAEEAYDPRVWQTVYRTMAAVMLIGVLVTLTAPEPQLARDLATARNVQIRLFVAFLAGVSALVLAFTTIGGAPDDLGPLATFLFTAMRMLASLGVAGLVIYGLAKVNLVPRAEARRAYLEPLTDFVGRYGRAAVTILVLIGIYRIADVVMGVIANVFYLEKGFDIAQIATYSKFYGLIATIAGGFLGGIIAGRIGVARALFIGAVLAAASNLLFAYLAVVDADVRLLMAVITADNLSGGFAGAAFVAYLSSLTNVSFTATQYALFTSIMVLLPKLLAGYSGSIVDAIGYSGFFVFSALLGVPVLFLIVWIRRIIPTSE